jgi:ATP-dependent DNA ligase
LQARYPGLCLRAARRAPQVITRKTDKRANLYSRPGNDLTKRFPSIAEAIARLRSRSCIIDGEAVACGEDWIADFERISAVGPGTHAP